MKYDDISLGLEEEDSEGDNMDEEEEEEEAEEVDEDEQGDEKGAIEMVKNYLQTR